MALLQTLTDNFDDNSVNTAKWPNNYNNGGNTLAETGGQGVITLDGTTFGYSAYYTSVTYDLTGSFALIKAPTVPSNSTSAQAYIKLAKDASNYVVLGKTSTNLYMQRTLAGVDSTTTTTYNSTDHLWWRISESGGSILWDTSPNGITWTNQRSLAPGFAVTAVTVEIGAGCYQVETSPGSFAFDNFNIIGAATAWIRA